MSKILVINGADFSENSAGKVLFNSYLLKVGRFGTLFLDYEDRKAIMEAANPAVLTEKIFVYNLNPSLAGKTISITAINNVIQNAYYNAFAQDLGNLSFLDIPNLSGEGVSPSKPIYYDIQESSIIETFNVSITDKDINTITKTIPTGANYLLVSSFVSSDFPEAVITILD